MLVANGHGSQQTIESRSLREDERDLKIFAERMFAREPAEARLFRSREERAAIASSALEFFRNRADEVAVRAIAGPRGDTTVVETLTGDCPFIVDSLLECYATMGAPVRLLLHPVFRVARGRDGALISFETAVAAETPESLVYSELELPPSTDRLKKIEREVRAVVSEVRRATGDFEAMVERALAICEETAADRKLVEIREFLRWLVHGGLVFLGYRRYEIDAKNGPGAINADREHGLGILGEYDESRFRPPSALDEFSAGELKLMLEGPALYWSKTAVESRVHRRGPMDSVMMRRAGTNGKTVAFDRFIGLLTSKAYAEEAQHIPIVRAKLNEILQQEDAPAGSHYFKEVVATFNSFPKEELLRASAEELRAQLRVLLDRKNDAAVQLSILPDQNRGHVIAMVIMPREAFSAEARLRIQNALRAGLKGKLLYYHLALGDSRIARLHFCFEAAPPANATVRRLEAEIVALTRSWDDQVREQIGKRFGAARGHELLERWGLAFGVQYKASASVDRALKDIEQIERVVAGSGFGVELNDLSDQGGAGASELRMFAAGEAPILSDLMPMLQNFGVRVLSEDAHQFSPLVEGKPLSVAIESFLVQGPNKAPLGKFPGVALLADAIAAVRAEQAENDPLNALTLTAGLRWREVALIRAYLSAAFQMRIGPARPAMRRVFLSYPELARKLFDLFAARLDPAGSDSDRPAKIRSAYLDDLSEVDNIADDRLARAVLSMVEATTRTNYFQSDPPGPYITLKFESGKILGLPGPAPLYEIHVNSPRMEGCHLRAGRVARGGIRFSDRPDDYRTEILDLMKTQIVKNAVIVPTGAKGGFIVKPSAIAAPAASDGEQAYQTLINAALDVTDNLDDKGIAHAAGVKVLDDDGPYLVVAADKGTASFSDLANDIAMRRGFWLGDAFASGGEHGFDHKKMAITARGAWESAKRHLREIGRDWQRGAPVMMAGIGDMSGDVFGNGLIYSSNLKLLAAFDHRHIFIDPDPDPAASFEERKRLYAMERSSWADYNPALISKGGGVFKRGLKRIDLTPEIQAALALEDSALDSDSLIHAILRAPVEMLYNGGIGTYVRASTETDAEVADHANDSCRIAANELRARIVVEGGNLGFTQKARIEYALNGGRINTDAIDNSAGVDTSDHEVNLKILLEPAVRRRTLGFDQRNGLLASCGNEVAQQVLHDNRDQALSLSLEQSRSQADAYAFLDHVQAIDERGLLASHEAALPKREELRARHSRYPGLTRPELAVIAAHTKIEHTMKLERAPLVDDSYLVERFLKPYFPPSIVDNVADEIAHHRLRRELVATRIINEMVDLMGAVFISSTARAHGVEGAQVIRAWVIASDILELRTRAEALRDRAYLMSAAAEIAGFLALAEAGRQASVWALVHCPPEMEIGAAVERYRQPFVDLSSQFEPLLTGSERERFELSYRELRATVNEEELAHSLARLAFADHLLAVVGLSQRYNIEILVTARVYFGLSAAIDFPLLEAALNSIATDDSWQRRASRELQEELAHSRSALCSLILEAGVNDTDPIAAIRSGRERLYKEVEDLIAQLRILPVPTIAALHVVVRSIARLSLAG